MAFGTNACMISMGNSMGSTPPPPLHCSSSPSWHFIKYLAAGSSSPSEWPTCTQIFLASSMGLILAAVIHFRVKEIRDLKIVPRIKLSDSGQILKLERFPHYVARQMGFADKRECPTLCKLASEYIRKAEGCEEDIYNFFAAEPGADSLFIKLVEELERLILSYFAFHWSQVSNMISQVLNAADHTEPKKKLKNIVMAATRNIPSRECQEWTLLVEYEGPYKKAVYQVTVEQKKKILEWLVQLRFPDGYTSNFQRIVDLEKLSTKNMKSHDCHVIMQRLLSVALKENLPANVWACIADVSQIFQLICSPVLNKKALEDLHRNLPTIMCNLEKVFPPSFFDGMEHLLIHLPWEARKGGPPFYRWMYSFERFLRELKKKVTNKAHVGARVENVIKNILLNMHYIQIVSNEKIFPV
ncbi:unnamed protein product [Cuscuta epithymum]|uniref:DUF4218 domain-containing protein n=1 Tax=Cuscuta epithymum TaxID=186058 RepID=A0AAV0G9R3_9ASTE|nr:unnamed protein product [Cuscuta epithymum]